MNKKITYLILLISSFSLYAEWKETLDLDVGGKVYLETDTIKEIDGYVYYWSMTDYNEPREKGFLSVHFYTQGDCKKMLFRTISYSFFEFNTGRGAAEHHTYASKDWVDPGASNTVAHSLLKAACKDIGEG